MEGTAFANMLTHQQIQCESSIAFRVIYLIVVVYALLVLHSSVVFVQFIQRRRAIVRTLPKQTTHITRIGHVAHHGLL
jgi:hypothetical protein